MTLSSVLAASMAAIFVAPTVQEFAWNRDFEQAQKKAEDAKKPLMLYFTTDWCGWCKVMERETFVDAKVQGQAARYVPVMLDAEKDGKALAQKYKVDSYPTFVFVQPSGEVIGTLNGFRNAADFQQRVTQILDGRTEESRLKEALDKDPNDPVANSEMAIKLIGDGKASEAEVHLDRARKAGFKGPEMAKALSDLGQLYSMVDMKKAMVIFEESLACNDESTTSVTFDRLMLTSLYAGDMAVSLAIAKRMSESPYANPEARAKGANFIKSDEYARVLKTPEAVTDALLKQLQGVPEGQRDDFYFTGLFMRNAAVNIVVKSQAGGGPMTLDLTLKTFLKTLLVDLFATKVTQEKRELQVDGDIAAARLELRFYQIGKDGVEVESTSVVNLHLICQGSRWYISSLVMQSKGSS
jgi:thioredoxin-related protein